MLGTYRTKTSGSQVPFQTREGRRQPEGAARDGLSARAVPREPDRRGGTGRARARQFRSALKFVERVQVKRLTFVPDARVWELIQ